MSHGEGRRDAYVPLLRFMEQPPQVVFGDYVCGIEETCLNYVPGYFKNIEFFHDIFHGCCHVCSERFCSRRLTAYASLNTSLMEQVRSENIQSYFNDIYFMEFVRFYPADEQFPPTIARLAQKPDDQGSILRSRFLIVR